MRYVLSALASLLVVRPLVVAISLLGSGVGLRTVAFIGWAGPRGLASIVYAVLIATTAGVPQAQEILLVAGWTILLSVSWPTGDDRSAGSGRAVAAGRSRRDLYLSQGRRRLWGGSALATLRR